MAINYRRADIVYKDEIESFLIDYPEWKDAIEAAKQRQMAWEERDRKIERGYGCSWEPMYPPGCWDLQKFLPVPYRS